LTPIEIDFGPVKKQEEDDEVDMIPLIDISMVLLVFFMMTAENLMTAAPFKISSVKSAEISDPKGNILVSIRRDPEDAEKKITYHFKQNYDTKYTEQEVLDMIRTEKGTRGTAINVVLQVESTLPFEKVQALMIGLERMGIKNYKAKVNPKGSSTAGTGESQ
jgi:biopolymer transport protein ExbD